MSNVPIQEGFQVFVSETSKAFGAVRHLSTTGHKSMVVYVENAGDFVVRLDAVKKVHDQKVIVDITKLDHDLRQAIGHAHDREDKGA